VRSSSEEARRLIVLINSRPLSDTIGQQEENVCFETLEVQVWPERERERKKKRGRERERERERPPSARPMTGPVFSE
jgi:hypothetical protein